VPAEDLLDEHRAGTTPATLRTRRYPDQRGAQTVLEQRLPRGDLRARVRMKSCPSTSSIALR
jgi:hypothetical protein